jgi:hypothetical protein
MIWVGEVSTREAAGRAKTVQRVCDRIEQRGADYPERSVIVAASEIQPGKDISRHLTPVLLHHVRDGEREHMVALTVVGGEIERGECSCSGSGPACAHLLAVVASVEGDGLVLAL